MKEINIIKIISKNIHDIRLEKNITLQELADKTNIDIKVLKKLGSRQNSGIGILQYAKIAKVLSVGQEEITKGIKFVED